MSQRRQNAPFSFIVFKFFSAGQNIVSNSGRMHHFSSLFSIILSISKISFQIPSECTIYRPCFHFFCISKSFEILSQCKLYHPCFHYLFFYCSSKSFLNTTIVHAIKTFCFDKFSAVPNNFQYRQNACLRENVFKIYSAVANRFKYRHNACCRDNVLRVSLQFQLFQIPSERML